MDAPDVPAWTITQQTPTSDLGPDGTYVSGIKVTFRTAAGVISHVFVPEASYSVEAVRKAVAARALTADAVAGLTG